MTNIFPLTMRREYADIVFFWKCLYRNYEVDVNDFVFSLMVYVLLVTRIILEFWWYRPCVVQTVSNVAFLME